MMCVHIYIWIHVNPNVFRLGEENFLPITIILEALWITNNLTDYVFKCMH